MPSREISRGTAIARAVSLADFTSESLLVPQLSHRDPAEIIRELSRLLQKEDRVPDLLPFYDAVLKRESMVSTVMEGEMAFPHARLSGLTELSFALGRSAQPIAWTSNGSSRIRLVFVIAVPANHSANYLHLISGLARLSKQTQLRERLCSVPSAKEMFAVLREIVIRTGQSAVQVT